MNKLISVPTFEAVPLVSVRRKTDIDIVKKPKAISVKTDIAELRLQKHGSITVSPLNKPDNQDKTSNTSDGWAR